MSLLGLSTLICKWCNSLFTKWQASMILLLAPPKWILRKVEDSLTFPSHATRKEYWLFENCDTGTT